MTLCPVLTDEQRLLHESLLTMRDKHIAHSVNSQEESWVAAQYYEERVEEEGFVAVSIQHGRTIGFSDDELAAIAGMARALLSQIDARIEIEEARLLPSAKSLSAKEILERPREITWASDSAPPDRRRKNP